MDPSWTTVVLAALAPIAGLVGVVLGGLLQERRDRQEAKRQSRSAQLEANRRVRVAARAAMFELQRAESVFRLSIETPNHINVAHLYVSDQSWQTYGPVLNNRLEPAAWVKVNLAFELIAVFLITERFVEPSTSTGQSLPRSVEGMGRRLTAITEALDVLTPLALSDLTSPAPEAANPEPPDDPPA